MLPLDLSSHIEASVLEALRGMLAQERVAGAAGVGGPGLPPAPSGRQRWMTLDDFVGFLETVGARSDDPLTVWRCGRNFLPTALETHFSGLHAGQSLGDALAAAIATISHLQSGSILRMRIEDSTALIEYRIVDPQIWPRARDAEFTLGFIEAIVRAYLGRDFKPDGLMFEHEPAGASRFDRAFGVPCIYGEAVNVLALPRSHLTIRGGDLPCGPSPAGGQSLPASVSSGPATAAGDPPADFVEQLRWAILEALNEGQVDQDRLARRCGLSARSLRRRLLAHGLSFRHEVLRARMSEAAHLLTHTSRPVGEIAERLGYDRQADFSRAFRRVRGMTPTALRRQACAGPPP